MDSQFLYFEDPLKLDFKAQIVDQMRLPDGRYGVILDSTYFSPTGGGQEHDTGRLGDARVIDVIKDTQLGKVIHVIDREMPLSGSILAHIDGDRRLRHMQHHTAQHLLTQCFIRCCELETVSANINGYTPSTFDLAAASVSAEDVERVERLANQVIYENRSVKSYFVDPAGLARLPLRRPPSVSENIRIVEIDSFDYTPCGGTHCLSTGSIGVIKILKTERLQGKTRVVFVAGLQALDLLRQEHDLVSMLAGQLNVGLAELSAAVQRQADQIQTMQAELQVLRFEKAAYEAQTLASAAENLGGRQVVIKTFERRPVQELRGLGEAFKDLPGVIAVLATSDEHKYSLLVACGSGAGASARDLLARLLVPLGGRGGGDAFMAQGGGPTTGIPLAGLPAQTHAALAEMLA